MDNELRLRQLEARYRAVLSAAGAAHAHYRALTETSATALALEAASAQWKRLEARRRSIIERIDELE